MRDPYSRRLHGRAFDIVAVYAVRHNCIPAEKAGLFIGLVIPFAVRTKRAHHGYLLKIFAEMRLRAEPVFRAERAKPRHKLIRTAWREARRYYGPYAAEAGKRFPDKAALFAKRALGCFAQFIGGVPVHAYFAHEAVYARALKLLHQHKACVRMHGGKRANVRCAARDKLPCKHGINLPREARVLKHGLRAESIVIKPLHKRQIHTKPQHGILRRVKMHIAKRGCYYSAAEVLYVRVLICGLQRVCSKHALYNARFIGYYNAVFGYVYFVVRIRGDYGSLYTAVIHRPFSF